MKKNPYNHARRSRAAKQTWLSPTVRRLRIAAQKARAARVKALLAADDARLAAEKAAQGDQS